MSAQQMHFAQELRGYIFALDGVLISIGGLMLALRDGRLRLGFSLHGLGSTIAIYCHATLLLWPAVAVIAALVVCRDQSNRQVWTGFFLSSCVIGATTSWWLYIYLQNQAAMGANLQWIRPLTARSYVLLLVNVLSGTFGVPSAWGWGVNAAILLMAAWGAWRSWSRLLTRYSVVALCLMIFLAQVVSITLTPIVTDRTMFWLSVFPVFLIAGGIATVANGFWRVASLILSAGLLMTNLPSAMSVFQFENWRSALSRVAEHPGASLVVEHEAMAVITRRACEFQFQSHSCPFSLIALTSDGKGDSWAQGLFGEPLLAPADVPAKLAPDSEVFVARHKGYDPLVRLGKIKSRSSSGVYMFLEGPFRARELMSTVPHDRL